jgi:hypothetical protein
VIVDDYNAVPACRQAVEDYRQRNRDRDTGDPDRLDGGVLEKANGEFMERQKFGLTFNPTDICAAADYARCLGSDPLL